MKKLRRNILNVDFKKIKWVYLSDFHCYICHSISLYTEELNNILILQKLLHQMVNHVMIQGRF